MKTKLPYLLKTTLLLMLVLANSILMAAEFSGGNIKGHVTTSDGKPAEFVTVSIKELNKATRSDEQGEYSLQNIKAGTYLLKVSFIGLEPQEKTVTVTSGKTSMIDFTLAETSAKLNEVTINARKTLNNTKVSLGKADISPLDLPQSTGIVTNRVIQDQQINHLGDAIRNVSGVTLTQTRGGVGETYSARGYSIGIGGGAGSVFKDGVLVNTAGFPEASTLEAVEVLKGSSALLYGNVSGGLIINMVTKKPKFENGGEVSMRYGSYNLYKPGFDIYGPISKDLAYRVVSTYENSNSYRSSVKTERFYVNPSFLYNIGKKTSLLLSTEFLKSNLTPDWGLGSLDSGRALPKNISRSEFINTNWAYSHMNQYTGTLTLKHQLSDNWNLAFLTSAQATQIDSYGSSLPNVVTAGGNWYRSLARANTTEDDLTAQVNLNGKFKTGFLSHNLLIGTDAAKVLNYSNAYSIPGLITTKVNGVNVTYYDLINTVSLDDGAQRTDVPNASLTTLTKSPSYRYGYYAQDLIGITDKFKVLAGLRYSIQKTEQTYLFDYTKQTNDRGTTATRFDDAFSPKVALIYQPVGTTSVYASYTNNFVVNTGIDVATKQNTAPSIVNQYEAGVKNSLFDGKLSANISVYRIVNNNLSVAALVDLNGNPTTSTTYRRLTGETTSDGLEIDITGNLSKNLYFITGYGYNHAYYSHSTGLPGSNLNGEPIVINPSNTANGSLFYTFDGPKLKGFKVGASAFYTGFRYAGYNNTIGQTQKYNRLLPVGGFATLDLSAGYTYKKLSLLASVTNVTNTMNYLIHDNYSVTPIPPTQFLTTLSYKF
ncbi:TonB-dependent receptor [Mucilaginibacter sp. PPCGB 2223]|uniref:TonB-dependent receptor n=1 Tax=Mucilaginibacter sp. PPCGB 2223 TaxID=1886027 RepID=UPI0008267E31|nr:TonB-dependent receptor [Mucilaginibacter sp. PPCGB 2223]OCX52570.1 TonB-dependent receptor [Mucilaginibacter sp. PPCGB 2223]